MDEARIQKLSSKEGFGRPENLTVTTHLNNQNRWEKIVVDIKTSLIVLLTGAKAWHIGLRGMNKKIDTIAHALMTGTSGIRKGF